MPVNIDIATYSQLLDSLYEGATTANKQRSFLSELKAILNLQHASLIVRQPSPTDSGLLFTSGQNHDVTMIEDNNNLWMGQYYAQDPLINLPINEVVTLEDIIHQDQLIESEYYQLFLKPSAIHTTAGLDWLTNQNSRISLRLSRIKSQGYFSNDEKVFLKMLIPHLERSMSLGIEMQQLESERQVYAQSISKRSIGMITLDKNGDILKMNNTAEQYLMEKDGLGRGHSALQLKNSSLNDLLKGYIKEALDAICNDQRPPINALAIPRSSGKHDYQLVVKPMPIDKQKESDGAPYLMIFLQDPEKNLEISVRLLMNLYHLTLSEATIAILLSEGNTMDEVAEELDIKKNTVRAHLRSIFAKTGVTQQSMLVSLVLTSLASTP